LSIAAGAVVAAADGRMDLSGGQKVMSLVELGNFEWEIFRKSFFVAALLLCELVSSFVGQEILFHFERRLQ
jgi:hypothetical protein